MQIDMPYRERQGESKLEVGRDGLRFLQVIEDRSAVPTFGPVMAIAAAPFVVAGSRCSPRRPWTGSRRARGPRVCVVRKRPGRGGARRRRPAALRRVPRGPHRRSGSPGPHRGQELSTGPASHRCSLVLVDPDRPDCVRDLRRRRWAKCGKATVVGSSRWLCSVRSPFWRCDAIARSLHRGRRRASSV